METERKLEEEATAAEAILSNPKLCEALRLKRYGKFKKEFAQILENILEGWEWEWKWEGT
jgi:hypothetical protein